MIIRIGFVFVTLFGSFVAVSQTAIEGAVRQHNGRPALFINDVPEYPMFYSLTDVPGGRWSWEEVPRYNLKSFCDIGIKLIQVDIAFDHIWKEDGTIVMDTVEKQMRGVLDVCPQAAIFIRFHVNPPKWWQKKFPEENTIYADTKPMADIGWGIQRIIEDDEENPTRHSLASKKWLDVSTQKLIEFLQKLSQLPEGKALAGIQVAGGVYGEWHYWGFIENEPDMSIHMQQYFRRWLSQKYKTNKSLQKAWGNAVVTRETAEIPTLEQRKQTREGVFRDPVLERNVIDYYEAQHDVIVDDIIHFCKVVKENWPRPIVTGAFYGYFYAVFGREAAGGHLQLQRLLNSPFIDYLSGPGTYYPSAVEMGEPYRSRSLINSVTLHGKLWLDEMDQQPPLVPLKDPGYRQGLEKSIAQVRRNVLFTFSKGQGLWFYDFGSAGFNGGPRLKDHGTWGWWDEPTLRRDIQALKVELEKHFIKPPTQNADVLLVHDTKSFYYTGSSREHSGIAHRANNWLPVGIFKSGVAHDVIDLADLDKVNLDSYKAVVFVNTFVMNSDQRRKVSTLVAKNNRHLIWVYAPAYCDEKKLALRLFRKSPE
ncbi:MAG TPA: beta-galactosidase [Chryseolinea sp.]|nr:beta-galactosidase [Chryseolinea sp.]